MFVFQADGDMIVTLDANFGLVRKQSSGKSVVEPLHGTRMFVDEKDVEEYLLSHLDSSKPHEVSHSCIISQKYFCRNINETCEKRSLFLP